MNLIQREFLRNGRAPVALVHQRPGVGRGRFHGRAQEALAAAMLNLNAGHAAQVFEGVGQPAQAHDVFVVANAQLVGRRLAALAVHKGVFHDNHAHLAAGQVFIAAHQTRGNGSVHVTQAGGLGRFANAVFDDHIADFARAEKRGEVGVHMRLSSLCKNACL